MSLEADQPHGTKDRFTKSHWFAHVERRNLRMSVLSNCGIQGSTFTVGTAKLWHTGFHVNYSEETRVEGYFAMT
jgi:hypothetical protein